MNSSATGVARTLRDVLLDAHEAASVAALAAQACGEAFPDNPQAEKLWRLLVDRVQNDVTICMALAHLADAVVDALERREFNAG